MTIVSHTSKCMNLHIHISKYQNKWHLTNYARALIHFRGCMNSVQFLWNSFDSIGVIFFCTDLCSGVLMLNYACLHGFTELTKEMFKVKSLLYTDYVVFNVCSLKCLRWGSPPTKLSRLIDIMFEDIFLDFLTKVKSWGAHGGSASENVILNTFLVQ